MLNETLVQEQFNHTSDRDLLSGLVEVLRPPGRKQAEEVGLHFEQLTDWLQEHPQQRYQLRKAITNLIAQSDMQYIFSESGLVTGSGFFAELSQKIIEKFLPTLLPEKDLRIAVRKIFSKRTDYRWINSVQESVWGHFFRTMKLNVHFENDNRNEQLLKAGEILSYRIASLGLDKRITAKSGDILSPQNAFVQQNKEWVQYCQLAADGKLQQGVIDPFSRMMQWIDMGLQQVREIRDNKKEKGTSLQQTFVLERIDQHLRRLQIIIAVIDPSVDVSPQQYTQYFKEIVENENTHNRLSSFLSRNFYYLAYQISEHGGRTGEKYITNNLKEYGQFFWSAAIGGFFISLAAFVKMELTNQHLPYFWASFCYGLNYSIAFVIIHFMNGTIATKQPALTASTIATALDNTNPKSPSLHNLALMNGKVMRSQLVSLLGNLVIVLPLTIFLAWAVHKISGGFLIAPSEVESTLQTVKPHIENIWYAAIAGVMLFLSGIISGYFDNMVIYGNIPRRLRKHKGLQKVFGKQRLKKISHYIDKNLGAIMGNVGLGFGLGFMIFFGKIFGLPLDIRHVTISTGFFGFAWFTTAFTLTWQTLAWCFTGLLLIAATNLLVSFTLALFTALKSRQIASRELIPLAKLTVRYFFKFPTDFIFPPRRERTDEELMARA